MPFLLRNPHSPFIEAVYHFMYDLLQLVLFKVSHTFIRRRDREVVVKLVLV